MFSSKGWIFSFHGQHIKMYISLEVHKHKIIDQRFWPVEKKKIPMLKGRQVAVMQRGRSLSLIKPGLSFACLWFCMTAAFVVS